MFTSEDISKSNTTSKCELQKAFISRISATFPIIKNVVFFNKPQFSGNNIIQIKQIVYFKKRGRRGSRKVEPEE